MSNSYNEAAHLAMERCDLLASFSEEQGRISRRFASPPMHQVHDALKGWLNAADIPVEFDAIGNLIGRYEGSRPGGKTLLLGSHLDSVINAGRYDGPLGVMVALACLERLHARGERLPFAVELLAFADEEGVRYHSLYMGSKAITGTFNLQDMDQLDASGISMAEALRSFMGHLEPKRLTMPRWSPETLLGYCEVHIEQGPVLETRNIPLALVSSIVCQQRLLFQLQGVQGHAGTLPMDQRQDALCAAAEFVLASEELARSIPDLVATVGQLQVQPGASNVVPGHVELCLDIRHPDNGLCSHYASQLCITAGQICQRRGLTLTYQNVQQSLSTECAPDLLKRWQQAFTDEGYPIFFLPSGAGHDAVAMSALTSVAMLFVRCRGGISHHPDESVLEADVAAAIAVLERFLLLTAQEMEM